MVPVHDHFRVVIVVDDVRRIGTRGSGGGWTWTGMVEHVEIASQLWRLWGLILGRSMVTLVIVVDVAASWCRVL